MTAETGEQLGSARGRGRDSEGNHVGELETGIPGIPARYRDAGWPIACLIDTRVLLGALMRRIGVGEPARHHGKVDSPAWGRERARWR